MSIYLRNPLMHIGTRYACLRMKVAKLIAVIFHAQQPHNAIYTVYATLWSEKWKNSAIDVLQHNCERVMSTAGVQFYCPSICNICIYPILLLLQCF